MELSCCVAAEQCGLAARAGFRLAVLSANELAGLPADALSALDRRLAALGLTCRSTNDFGFPALRLCGPGYLPRWVEDYARRLAPRAAGLGIERLGVGAPLCRRLPEGYPRALAGEQMRESLLRLAGICRPYGIQVLLEPICAQVTNFLNDTREVLEVLEACGGEVGMVYDIYHAWRTGETPEALKPAAGRIGTAHIAHHWNAGRHIPLEPSMDRYRPYLRSLLETGYDGELAIEAGLDGVDASQLEESRRTLERAAAGIQEERSKEERGMEHEQDRDQKRRSGL